MRKVKIVVYMIAIAMCLNCITLNTEAASPKLNKNKISLYVGSSTTLKIKNAKSKITWKSSNKKVATVSSKGKVTAKKKGTATITAKVSSKTYKCKVTVKNPYLSKTSLTLTEGSTHTLRITGTKASSWSSSNKSVATISKKGVITAKKAGTVTITCKGKNKKTYKCSLTVQAKAQAPSQPNQPSQPTPPTQPTPPSQPTPPADPTQPSTPSTPSTPSQPSEPTQPSQPSEPSTPDVPNTPDEPSQPSEPSTPSTPVCTNHNYVTIEVLKETTCLDNGLLKQQCSLCNDVIETVDTTTGHLYGEFLYTVEPTCTVVGTVRSTCSRCGDYLEYQTTTIDHEYKLAKTNEPTCTTYGTEIYECEYGCGASYTKTTASMLPHDWVVQEYPYYWDVPPYESLAEISKATCTEPALYYSSCKDCLTINYNEEDAGYLGEALGHQLTEEEVVVDESYYMHTGSMGYKCLRDNCTHAVITGTIPAKTEPTTYTIQHGTNPFAPATMYENFEGPWYLGDYIHDGMKTVGYIYQDGKRYKITLNICKDEETGLYDGDCQLVIADAETYKTILRKTYNHDPSDKRTTIFENKLFVHHNWVIEKLHENGYYPEFIEQATKPYEAAQYYNPIKNILFYLK